MSSKQIDLNTAIDRIMSNEKLCYKSDEEYFYSTEEDDIADGTRIEDITECFQSRFKDSTDFLDCKVSWSDNYNVDYNTDTGVCTSKSGIRVKFTKSDQLKKIELNNAIDKIISKEELCYKSEGECFYSMDDIADGTLIEDIIACFQRRFKDSTVSFAEEYVTDCNLVISKCGILVIHSRI